MPAVRDFVHFERAVHRYEKCLNSICKSFFQTYIMSTGKKFGKDMKHNTFNMLENLKNKSSVCHLQCFEYSRYDFSGESASESVVLVLCGGL